MQKKKIYIKERNKYPSKTAHILADTEIAELRIREARLEE